MTNINPVYEIQQYLRALSQYGYAIPLIIPDGIYGQKTNDAVRSFQRLIGLPQSGIVDYATWVALRAAFEEAEKLNESSAPIYPFEEILLDGKITKGNELPLVYIIQIILRTVGTAYKNLEQQSITGVYDNDTMNNIRDFQKVNGIPITGEVDKQTWNRLAEAYNKYLNKG